MPFIASGRPLVSAGLRHRCAGGARGTAWRARSYPYRDRWSRSSDRSYRSDCLDARGRSISVEMLLSNVVMVRKVFVAVDTFKRRVAIPKGAVRCRLAAHHGLRPDPFFGLALRPRFPTRPIATPGKACLTATFFQSDVHHHEPPA